MKREHEKWSLVVEAGVEKQDMVNRLRDILVWQALPLPELCKPTWVSGDFIFSSPQPPIREQREYPTPLDPRVGENCLMSMWEHFWID